MCSADILIITCECDLFFFQPLIKLPCSSAICPTRTTHSSKLQWWTSTTSPTSCGSWTSRWCHCWTSRSPRWGTQSTSSSCCSTKGSMVCWSFTLTHIPPDHSARVVERTSATCRSPVLRWSWIWELRKQFHGACGCTQPVSIGQLSMCSEHPQTDAGEGNRPQRFSLGHVQEEVRGQAVGS